MEMYVEHMVEVFRAIWRVLRKDGTCWVNLGMSYASGDMRANQSPLLQRVPAYGTDGKAPSNSRASDFSCCDPGDEFRDGSPSHRGRNTHNGRQHREALSPLSQTNHDNGPRDSAEASLGASSADAPVSKTRASFRRDRAACVPSNVASERQQSQQTFENDAPLSVHNSAGTYDTAPMSPPLVVRTSGKESFFSACKRSDCRGIGKCGLCWSCLAIPSLNVKAKDELNTPHLVALALQADGWVLRQTIIFSKPNPMPESVTDRCCKSHEYLFLLSKSEQYYFDHVAIAEPSGENTHVRKSDSTNESFVPNATAHTGLHRAGTSRGGRAPGATPKSEHASTTAVVSFRNKRSVWKIVTEPFPDAHFAVFPTALVIPCIKAGTSERGCCANCGAPWERITAEVNTGKRQKMADGWDTGAGGHGTIHREGREKGEPDKPVMAKETIGWYPTCSCDALTPLPPYPPKPKEDLAAWHRDCQVITEQRRRLCEIASPIKTPPGTVLDPFGGAMTTALVADRLQRNSIMIELSESYIAMAERRLKGDAPLFTEVDRGG